MLATLAGCGGSDLVLPGNGAPADLRMVNGDNQTGLAGSPLAQPLEVKVLDERGDPLSGYTVVFGLDTDAPGARLDPDSTKSSQDGVAQSRWTLGATSGTQSVVARVTRDGSAEPLEVRFSASVAAGAANKIARVSGDEQTAEVGQRLGDPLVVLVTDEFGNPIEGVAVDWTAEEGSADPSSSVTGSDGRAQTSWTLGPATGSQSATASSSGLAGSPVSFTATGRAGGADRLVRVSGNDQSARVGTELGNPLVVRLVDKAGNGVPNRAVTWVVGAGGGSVPSTTTTTDGDGEAQTRWTLGPTPVTNTLSAVVSGVSGVGVVAFTATAIAGDGGTTPSRLQFVVQPSDTKRDKTISPPVQVAVLDQDGNRVTDEEFEIKLELAGGDDGELKGHVKERTRSGVATFNDLKVDKEGDYRLRAFADGLSSVDSDRFEVKRD